MPSCENLITSELPASTVHKFRAGFAAAECGGFDEGEVVVVVSWTAEAVAAKRAEEAAIGPAAAGEIDGDGEEISAVVGALAKVVLAVLTRSRKMRHRDLVGPVRSGGTITGLLNS